MCGTAGEEFCSQTSDQVPGLHCHMKAGQISDVRPEESKSREEGVKHFISFQIHVRYDPDSKIHVEVGNFKESRTVYELIDVFVLQSFSFQHLSLVIMF